MKTKRQITLASLAFTMVLVPVGSRLSQTEEDPAVRLERAIQLETVDGDLEAAIEQYQEILAENGNQRAIAAKAMLRLGGCYEKLGQREAMSVYERLVMEYPDQAPQAEAARQRLAQLSVASPEKNPTFRKVEIPGRPDNGVFSPDGNRLAFFADGGLWIAPARGNVSPNIAGEPARIADVPGGWALGNLLSWSWNGEWIAVNGELEGEEAAFIIPVKGGEGKRVSMPPRGGHAQSYRLSLSPNGEQLAFSALELGLRDSDRLVDRYIYTIPTEGGAPHRLTFEWSRLPAWSPDGKYISYVGYREREDWSEDSERSRYHGDLWVVPSEGGTPVRLQTAEGRFRGPVWSPDGQWIAVHHEPGRGNDSREIWALPALPDAAGRSDPIKITLPRSTYLMLAGWTPQDQIGFFMETEMHVALYTVTSSGGKAVQVSPQGFAWYPRWSRDGERIYHRMVARPEEGQPFWLFQVPSAGGSPTGIPVESKRRLSVMIPGGG
ncbi:MAG: PD40 domain-containing protein, partial [Acidobacteriota bacterium]